MGWAQLGTITRIENLGDNLQKLLDFKNPIRKLSCGQAVQKLLDVAALKFPRMRGQNSKTLMEAFKRINSQGGFIAYMPRKLFHYGGTVDGDAFAYQDPGSGAKPGQVWIQPFKSDHHVNNEQAQVWFLMHALHETFHLAARGGYSDREMAEVVADITGWKLPEPTGNAAADAFEYSDFWDHYLTDHCRILYLSDLK